MSYIIPETTRTQWKEQAQAAGKPYATVVGQQIQELQRLGEVLDQQLAQTKQTLSATAADSPAANLVRHKVAELSKKLDHSQQQLAAYKQEQNQPAPLEVVKP